MNRLRSIEWPTLLVALLVHAGWVALTLCATRLPLWLLAPLGGFVVAWHGSLQHETIHGHPTRSRAFNALVASLPVGLWMPYGVYRRLHLAHHNTSDLADPIADPESFYVTEATWNRLGAFGRAVLWINATLVGRLLVGPVLTIATFLRSELARLLRRDFRHVTSWIAHVAGVALVVFWLEHVCGLAFWRYAVAFVFPGLALTLLRSFAEHRPAPSNPERIAIVEAGPVASLLYLNNNLHVVHHDHPTLPWYELPARYRATRDDVLRGNGGNLVPGYGALLARFGLRPKDRPAHQRQTSS